MQLHKPQSKPSQPSLSSFPPATPKSHLCHQFWRHAKYTAQNLMHLLFWSPSHSLLCHVLPTQQKYFKVKTKFKWNKNSLQHACQQSSTTTTSICKRVCSTWLKTCMNKNSRKRDTVQDGKPKSLQISCNITWETNGNYSPKIINSEIKQCIIV